VKTTLKHMGLFSMIFVLAVMAGCRGDEKSEEIRIVMGKNLNVMEDFIGTVEETEETQVYISALQKLKEDFQSLIPEMKGLNEKYPGLFDLDDNKIPLNNLWRPASSNSYTPARRGPGEPDDKMPHRFHAKTFQTCCLEQHIPRNRLSA